MDYLCNYITDSKEVYKFISLTTNTPGVQTRRNRRDLIPFPTEPATPTEELLDLVLKGAVMLLMNLYAGVAD